MSIAGWSALLFLLTALTWWTHSVGGLRVPPTPTLDLQYPGPTHRRRLTGLILDALAFLSFAAALSLQLATDNQTTNNDVGSNSTLWIFVDLPTESQNNPLNIQRYNKQIATLLEYINTQQRYQIGILGLNDGFTLICPPTTDRPFIHRALSWRQLQRASRFDDRITLPSISEPTAIIWIARMPELSSDFASLETIKSPLIILRQSTTFHADKLVDQFKNRHVVTLAPSATAIQIGEEISRFDIARPAHIDELSKMPALFEGLILLGLASYIISRWARLCHTAKG